MTEAKSFWVVELVKDAAAKLVFSPAVYWSGKFKSAGQAVPTVDIFAAKKYLTREAAEVELVKLSRLGLGEWAAVEHGWM